ncbi:hypothetical protein [Selenihalanaerobacter shriftii]|uniref:Planctomycete cytochrome C n=1 Tax=Selenihalanaerobacter shriftii TaxID=142842 RepID=A0A1T4KH85_9FIRM|nr:hypothetical protein [Selenihalanaerobacter shriftii]SJZ41764.1 hypothetical protein SAMN02745118_00779 [Selenihalanaerobacter shriftii]
MRKLLSILLAAFLVITIVGCSSQDKVPGQEDQPRQEVPQTDEFSDPAGPEKLNDMTEKSVDEVDEVQDLGSDAELDNRKQKPTYQADIKPILQEDCINCHKNESTVGEENKFSNYQEIMRFVKPGKPKESKLVISIQDDNSMRKYINTDEINIIEYWVRTGAKK